MARQKKEWPYLSEDIIKINPKLLESKLKLSQEKMNHSPSLNRVLSITMKRTIPFIFFVHPGHKEPPRTFPGGKGEVRVKKNKGILEGSLSASQNANFVAGHRILCFNIGHKEMYPRVSELLH